MSPLPRTACATVTPEEQEAIQAAAAAYGTSVAKFMRRAVLRTLRGPWSEEQDMQAEYDEIEIEVPSSSRFAKFALLVPQVMEECEYKDHCDHCAAFLTVVAPDLVLSIDKFKLSEDGLTVTSTRAGMRYETIELPTPPKDPRL